MTVESTPTSRPTHRSTLVAVEGTPKSTNRSTLEKMGVLQKVLNIACHVCWLSYSHNCII